jgi:hypothetical protein
VMLVGVTSVRDLRQYGDSTTVGRLLLLQRRTLFGQDVGIETQRSITANLSYTPNLGPGIRPRFTMSNLFSLSRDPNATAPVFTADSAFRLPQAFANSQRLDMGMDLDPGRLSRGFFGDSSWVVRVIRHLTNISLAYSRSRQSSFSQVAGSPTADYQLGLGSLTSFRFQGGVPASSALETATTSASGGADLVGGLRITTTYQTTTGVTWFLQGTTPVPLEISSLDWPSGSVAWTISPSRNGLGIGQFLSGATAQLAFRRHVSTTAQSLLGAFGTTQLSLNQATDRALAPSLTLTWIYGILTSADYSTDRSESVQSGSLFLTRNTATNAYIAFAFRPPQKLIHLPTPIRASARVTVTATTTCIEATDATSCVSYVDTRQRQTQFSMDTDFPPLFSAGLQVGYILNEQRQLNQKNGDLTITAYVSLSTSVGQFR